MTSPTSHTSRHEKLDFGSFPQTNRNPGNGNPAERRIKAARDALMQTAPARGLHLLMRTQSLSGRQERRVLLDFFPIGAGSAGIIQQPPVSIHKMTLAIQ
jgi:hypothetical protein